MILVLFEKLLNILRKAIFEKCLFRSFAYFVKKNEATCFLRKLDQKLFLFQYLVAMGNSDYESGSIWNTPYILKKAIYAKIFNPFISLMLISS